MDGWPTLQSIVSSFPLRNCGCPVLAFFARAGTMRPIHELLCPPVCIAPTARTICTLSRATQIAISEMRSSWQSIPLHSRTDAAALSIRRGRLCSDAGAYSSAADKPEVGSPSTVMQVLKQRKARALLPRRKWKDPRQNELFEEQPRRAFWQVRFYDFNVWTAKKRVEKLRYMHRNPVKRGLVESPEQ